MTKKPIKILTFFLVLLFAGFFLTSIPAFANSCVETFGDWDCVVSDYGTGEEAYIVKYHGTAVNVTIPSCIDEYKVVSVGASHDVIDQYTGLMRSALMLADVFSGTDVKNVVIPSTVKYIGWEAFWEAESLVSVQIPGSVVIIDDSAFSGCVSLSSINIPNGVKEIGTNAFEGCTKLKTVKIPKSVTKIDYSAFTDCSNLATIYYAGSYLNWYKMVDDDNEWLKNVKMVYAVKANPTISLKKLTLRVKKTKKLTVKGAEGTVKWTSSKSSVASVSAKGLVTAKKAGTCTITATASGRKASCKVTVLGPIKVKKITCAKTITISVSQSKKLSYTVSPSSAANKKVKITSSKSSVVKVQSGKIIGKKVGTAYITIRAKDGSKVKAVCKVKVVKKKKTTKTTSGSTKKVKCRKCAGTGVCQICYGSGLHAHCGGSGKRYNVFYNRYEECGGCNGTGRCACWRIYQRRGKCIACGGKGYY